MAEPDHAAPVRPELVAPVRPDLAGPTRPRPMPVRAIGTGPARPAPRPGARPRPETHALPQTHARPELRSRPDPNPMRLMAGFVGLASLSAIASGLLPTVVPAASAGNASTTATIAADPASLPVQHVTRYVQLKPGQTAPPQAAVVAAPKPTPRVVVVTTTRQSGKP